MRAHKIYGFSSLASQGWQLQEAKGMNGGSWESEFLYGRVSLMDGQSTGWFLHSLRASLHWPRDFIYDYLEERPNYHSTTSYSWGLMEVAWMLVFLFFPFFKDDYKFVSIRQKFNFVHTNIRHFIKTLMMSILAWFPLWAGPFIFLDTICWNIVTLKNILPKRECWILLLYYIY
jgi:hypothetical protein